MAEEAAATPAPEETVATPAAAPEETPAAPAAEEEAAMSVEAHPDDAPQGIGEEDGVVEGEGTMGEYKEGEEYHTMAKAAYAEGQKVQVLRSDESYSPATITAVTLTAMGAVYDVQLEDGNTKCGVPEGELYVE